MRPVAPTLIKADRRRMHLGLRASQLGLPNPLASAQERGFKFTHIAHSDAILMSYKDRKVASLTANNDVVFVDETMPVAADEIIKRLFERLRDAARQVDRALRADKKHMEERVRALDCDIGRYGTTQEDLFLLVSFANRLDSPLRISRKLYFDDTFSVRIKSDLTKENDVIREFAFEFKDDCLSTLGFMPKMPLMIAMIEQAKSLQEEILSGLNLPKSDVSALPENADQELYRLRNSSQEVNGVTITVRNNVMTLSADDVPLMTIEVLAGEDNALRVRHGPMGDDLRSSLLSVAKSVMDPPAPVKTQDKAAVQSAIMQEAGQALQEIDLGYDW